MRHLLATVMVSLWPLTAVASDHDFNAAVHTIEQTYHVHRQTVPMIGLASFCVHVASGGAIKGIRIAAFNERSALPQAADMPSLLAGTLGSSWSLIVDSRSNGEQDALFARPAGDRMLMLVASYDHGDFALVRVSINASEFTRWMRDPVAHAQGHARSRETN